MKRLATPYFLFAVLLSFALERGVFVLFLEEAEFSSIQISVLQIVFFVSCFLAEIPTGMIGDKIGRRASVALGSISMGIGVGLQYLSKDSFLLMILAFVIHAVAFAFVSGSITALFYDELKKAGEVRLYASLLSFYRLLGSLGLGFAMGLGGVVQVYFSWKHLYYISAAIQASSVIPVLFMHETRHTDDDKLPFFRGFFSGAQDIFPAVLPISLIHAAMTPYFVYAQKLFKDYDVGIETIAATIATIEVTSAICVVALTKRAPDFTTRKITLLIAIFALILALNYWAQLSTLWLFISLAFFASSSLLVMYIGVLSDSYYQSRIKQHSKRASIMSFTTFVDTAAIGVGYLFFGLLLNHLSTSLVIALSSLFPFLSLLIIKLKKNA